MQLRLPSIAPITLTLALIPLLSACPVDDDGGLDEVGETEDTTDETDGTDGSGETAEADTETGDPEMTTEGVCMQACALVDECGDGFPECVGVCIETHELFNGACLTAQQTLTSCVSGLTCEQLDQYMESSPDPYPCQEEEAQTCTESCDGAMFDGENPGECTLEYYCPALDPTSYEVVCDGDSCVCLENSIEVASCSDAVELCTVGESGLFDTCCGWEL